MWKVTACLLVVAGYLLQSLVKADILFGGMLYRWFDKTVYYFHVINPIIHIIAGLAASIGGPFAIAELLKKTKRAGKIEV